MPKSELIASLVRSKEKIVSETDFDSKIGRRREPVGNGTRTSSAPHVV